MYLYMPSTSKDNISKSIDIREEEGSSRIERPQ